MTNAVLAGEGDLEAKELRRRLNADPGNTELRLRLASHYRKQGLRDLAIEHCRLAIERTPHSEEAGVMLVETLFEAQEKAEALHTAESLNGNRVWSTPRLASWLGIMRDDAGNWRAGESAHRAALAIGPGSAKLHNNLGYNLLMQGKLSEAIEELRLALTADPKLASAHSNLAAALAQGAARERADAIAHWTVALDAGSAHNNMAAALITQGQYGEARRELEIALSHRMDLPQVFENLRLVSELDGKPAELHPAGAEAKSKPLRAAAQRVWSVLTGTERKPSGGAASGAGSE